MQQNFTFNKMNTDIADKFLPQGVYRSMRNCRPNNRNTKSGGVVENIPSTLAITTISFGENVEYVGGCADAKRNAIISFYNGDTRFYITSFDTTTNTESFLLISSLIARTGRVLHSTILDDELFWIDGVNKIRKVNIEECTGTLNQFTASELLIDKFPPLFPPTVAAVADSTFEGNNITNSIFQFAYAYQYDNKEQSSWSPFSKSVLPASTNDEDIVFPNNAIDITVTTGTDKVKKIYIAYRQGESADWKLYDTLDKTKLSISDDTTYAYRFYNNKYTAGLFQADVLNYTYNPYYQASSLALSKDNFLIIGGVKDGLTKPTNIVLTASYTLNTSTTRVAGYKMGCVHEFGVIFRDENGRTDGVNSRVEVQIPSITELGIGLLDLGLVPYTKISWSVSGDAPTWAKTMSIVYLGNKTMSSYVDYVLSDIQDAGAYTYLDISALNSIKDSGSVLYPNKPSSILSTYVFTKGDRIKFTTDKNGDLLDTTSNDYDYEILGYVNEVTSSTGTVLFPNTIYINKIGWSAANIGKKSAFEIYTPKKEFKDSLFYEVAEVFGCDNGTILTTSGVLSDGDSYDFIRNAAYYETGELLSDKTKQYDYRGNVGITPDMGVIRSADGIKTAAYSVDEEAGSFYKNTTGSPVQLVVTVGYEFTSGSNDGYWFKLRMKDGSTTVQDYTIFEEPNDMSDVFHKGTFTQNIYVANNHFVNLYFDNHDDKSSHFILYSGHIITLSVKVYDFATGESTNLYAESKNYSDYFDSDEHSLGRPFVEVEEDTKWKNQLVVSGKYFENTAINEINKISSLNSKQVPYGFGFLKAIRVKGDTLKIFTPAKEISAYLGKESFVDGAGNQQQSITNTPIGDIRPYDSDFGTENAESLLMTASSIYYYDRKNAAIIQTSSNGHFDIAEKYGCKTYLRDVTARINAATTYNVFIGYNDKNFEVVICFVIDGVAETLVFNEVDNAFTHYLDYADASDKAPQGMMNYGESMLVYVNGAAYLNERGTGVNEFFGDQKDSVVSFVVNESPISTKVLRKVSIQSDHKWNVEIETEPDTAHPQGTYTVIREGRLQQKEGIYFSDVPRNLRDKTGVLRLTGYANGDEMRGRTAVVMMTSTATEDIRLDAATVDFVGSSVQ